METFIAAKGYHKRQRCRLLWHKCEVPTVWVNVRVWGVNRTYVGHRGSVAFDPGRNSNCSVPDVLGCGFG
jgi:hypothetical protein